MKTAVLLLGLAAIGQKDPDETRITITFTETPMAKVVDLISARSGIPIEWTAEAQKKVDGKATINLDIRDLTVSGALKLVLLPEGLDVKVVDKRKVRIVVP